MYEQWKSDLDAEYEQIIAWRRYLHQHPELSFQETETARYIAEQLQSIGLNVKMNVGGNGILSVIEGAHSGPTIAFRADFDALPIQEENDVPYRSLRDGVMHACGHDGHTAALLGVAKVLQRYREHLRGRIVLIFQHAEEKPPGGAKDMIDAGALDGVDAVYGAHLASYLPLGQAAATPGTAMAAVDAFTITVKGKGGHGAKPHETVDALVIGSQIVGALQHIVSRHIDPLHSAVVTVGVFRAGSAFNVIADKAVIEGTVRTFNETIRGQVEKDIRDIVHGVTLAGHAGYDIDYLNGYPALVNDPEESAKVATVISDKLGNQGLVELPPSMGAEDFAYYLQHRPGAFFNVGSRGNSDDTGYPHHHPRFDFDEQALLNSGYIFLGIAAKSLL
ncbi:amidohydrolase [Paenibacillus sp. CAU 1782]